MGRAQRHTAGGDIPIIRLQQQVAYLCMNQPDANRQFPAVPMTLQRAGQHNLNKMTRVLPNAPRTVAGQHPARQVKSAANQRGGIL